MREKTFLTNRGIAIVMVVIFTLILLIIGAAFLRLATTERISADRNVHLAKAFYIAEAGIEKSIVYLESLSSPPAGIDPFDPFGGWQNFDGGSYQIVIDPDDSNPGSSIKKYKITAKGKIVNPEVTVTKFIQLELSQESFAKYAYFTDYESILYYGRYVPVWFLSGDIIEGPLHSNDQIHIYGSPTFMGRVTSTASSFDYYQGGPPLDNPNFQQGYQLGVEEIDMDKYENMNNLSILAESGGLKLDFDSKIQLNSDGTLTYWTKVSGNWDNPEEIVWTDTTIVSLPSNGVLYVGGNALISGTLNGQLTLAVEDSAYILEDILYSISPTNPACTDMLGLIAGDSVVVAKDSPPGDSLEIDATIMAFDGSFIVQDYRYIPVMGNLTVYGGVIQNRRGPVGTFSSQTGQRLSGYLKDYHYDTRVKDNPPPYFPTTGEYKRDFWEEEPAVWE